MMDMHGQNAELVDNIIASTVGLGQVRPHPDAPQDHSAMMYYVAALQWSLCSCFVRLSSGFQGRCYADEHITRDEIQVDERVDLQVGSEACDQFPIALFFVSVCVCVCALLIASPRVAPLFSLQAHKALVATGAMNNMTTNTANKPGHANMWSCRLLGIGKRQQHGCSGQGKGQRQGQRQGCG